MEIGNRINELRKEHLKMTQQAFADNFGISRDTLNNIERNRLKKPQQYEPLYRLICETYNVSYEWLTTGTGDMLVPLSHSEEIIDFAAAIIKDNDESFRRRLITALSKLTSEQWTLLEEIVDKIKED